MPLKNSVIVGESSCITKLRAYAEKVAASDASVLITGETGTGKECLARYLHECSRRAANQLISINCSAVPDGLLESELFGYERGAFTGAHSAFGGRLRMASGGTLFLDEIGEMSPFAQAKILRAIEEREVTPLGGRHSVPFDVRIVAATNVDPATLVRSGRLRKDLYYRLNVVHIHLPPIRDRKEDITFLFSHFMRQRLPPGTPIPSLNQSALDHLLYHDWPGNVREIRNLVERLLVDLPEADIGPENLPSEIRGAAVPSGGGNDDKARVLAALVSTHWNKRKAAQVLQWSRMTLYRKLAKYDIASKSARRLDTCRTCVTSGGDIASRRED